MPMVETNASKKERGRQLLFAAFCESVAIVAGLLAYALTKNWIWLAIGVLAGTAFTLPAVIAYVRTVMEERSDASR